MDFGAAVRSYKHQNGGNRRRGNDNIQKELAIQKRCALPRRISQEMLYGEKHRRQHKTVTRIDYTIFLVSISTVIIMFTENEIFYERKNVSGPWNHFLRSLSLTLTLITVVLIHFKYASQKVDEFLTMWDTGQWPKYLLEIFIHLISV